MASPTQWTWVWVDSRSWWWTRRPGVLWFMGLQRVGHDWGDLAAAAARNLQPGKYHWRTSGHPSFYSPHSSIDTCSVQFSRSVEFRLFVTPWTAAHQASLSIANSRSLLKLMSFEWVMPSNHLILCCPLLLLPSIFRTIRVFSDESVLRTRWPKYWSFSFSMSSSSEYSGLISFRMDWLDLLAV